jgi:membrane-bound lytic murein transglycosylase A
MKRIQAGSGRAIGSVLAAALGVLTAPVSFAGQPGSRDPAIPPYPVAPVAADRAAATGPSAQGSTSQGPAAAGPIPQGEPWSDQGDAGPVPIGTRLRSLSSLPGWASEDHLAALKAFQAGCGVAHAPEWKVACARARLTSANDDGEARTFFEANFAAESPAPAGLLTAYFAPVYPAQALPDEIFSAPVRPRPLEPDAYAGRPRADIETDPAEGVHAFLKPEDLFFLQIQGSGVLSFPDGRRMKAIYAGDNGLPFTPIARPMLKSGFLTADHLSGDAIRAWLAEHRGDEADAVMDQDQRFVFFDLVPDDGQDPAGAAGAPLPAGRAIAVDPAYHRYGALYWIDADAPSLTGAVPVYRRLALALDTGAAIRGERRADLYLGRGDSAGQEAGRVRHVLNLVRLVPLQAPAAVLPFVHQPAPPAHETTAPAGGG